MQLDSLANLMEEDVKFDEVLHMLLNAEKVSRAESDFIANSKALCDILELCISSNEWLKLEESIQTVTCKSGVMKQSLQKFMDCGIEKIPRIPMENGMRCRIVEVLRTVCDGKLYLEQQHVKLLKILADIYEAEGNVEKAASILDEIRIDAFGSLATREKIVYILFQIRLNIATGRMDNAQILSKKIQLKFLYMEGNEDLKEQFYRMKIQLEQDSSFLETSRYYYILAKCPLANEALNTGNLNKDLCFAALNCALSPHDKDQSTFLLTLLNDPLVKQCTIFYELLQTFSSKEIIPLVSFENRFHREFVQSGVAGVKRMAVLVTRLIEHNILILAKYYSRIYIDRISELIGVSPKICEQTVSELVNRGSLQSKIDRYKRIVEFKWNNIHQENEHYLNNWLSTINEVMKLTNKTAYIVQNEMSQHSVVLNSVREINLPIPSWIHNQGFIGKLQISLCLPPAKGVEATTMPLYTKF